MSDFTKLKVWQEAHKLTLKVYDLTSKLPKEETFGLVNQMRRAAVSVESNIAEGEARYGSKDKLNFFIQSRSSIAELQTQLLVIADLHQMLKLKALSLKDEYTVLYMQLNSLISYRRKADL